MFVLQAAFSVFSGGPLDIIIGKSQIKTTVTRVFEARHNASASLEGRGAVAKVLRSVPISISVLF